MLLQIQLRCWPEIIKRELKPQKWSAAACFLWRIPPTWGVSLAVSCSARWPEVKDLESGTFRRSFSWKQGIAELATCSGPDTDSRYPGVVPPVSYLKTSLKKSEERGALNSDFTACSKLLINLVKNQSGCWMKGYTDIIQIFLDPYLVTKLHSLIQNINKVFIVPTLPINGCLRGGSAKTTDSVSQSCWTLQTSESQAWKHAAVTATLPSRPPNLPGFCRLDYTPWAHFKTFSQSNMWN